MSVVDTNEALDVVRLGLDRVEKLQGELEEARRVIDLLEQKVEALTLRLIGVRLTDGAGI